VICFFALVILVLAEQDEKTQLLRIEGEEAMKARQYDKAISKFSEAIELDPSDVHYHRRGLVYLTQDKLSQAIRDLSMSLEKNPRYTHSLSSRARAYTLRGDFEKAQKDYELLVNLKDEKAPDKLKDLKANLRRKQQISKDVENEDCNPRSVEIAKEIIVDAPFDFSSGFFVSQCLLIYGDSQEVFVYSGKLMKIPGKTNPDVILIRAKAYILIQEDDMATKHIKAGLKAEPEHRRLKLLHKTYKAFKKAKDRANKAISKKKWMNAHNEYKEILSFFPNHVQFNKEAYSQICFTARRQRGKFTMDQRVKFCDQAVEYCNTASAFIERARLYNAERKWEEAVRDYERGVGMDNSNRQWHNELANAKKELKISLRKDYYKILDTHKHATEKELKKKFRKCAIKYHPDKFVKKTEEEKEEADKQYKDCVEANDVLTNREMKAKYDRGEDPLDNQGGGGGGFHGGFPSHFFRRGGGGGQRFNFRHN